MIYQIIKGTLFSILIFFSISFLTVLFQLNSPLNRFEEDYELKVGFPFQYYRQFIVSCKTPNSGWNVENLLLDCGITWMLTILLFIAINRKNKVP